MPKTKGKNADKMSVNSENIPTTKQKQLHKNPVYTLEVGIIGGGLDGVEKIVQAVSEYLYVKLNTTIFSFFSTNGHIFPVQFNTRNLRNDGF